MVIRKKIQNISSWFLGRSPIISLLNLLNDKYGGFILAYHNPSIETVLMHLKVLSTLKVVPLDEIVDRVKKGNSTRGIFAITVDDGVGTTIRNLSMVVKDLQMPITFFLPTSYINTGKQYWFQRLFALFKTIHSGKIIYSATEYNLEKVKDKKILLNLIYNELFNLHPIKAEEMCQTFIENSVSLSIIDSNMRLGPAPISWEEVSRFAIDELISFEPHSVNHPNFSVLSVQEIESEILDSKRRIEDVIGKECKHFCYPFGDKEAIGNIAPSITQKYLDSAVTLQRGRLYNVSPWYMPRIPLYNEDSQRLAAFKISSANQFSH